MAPAPPPLTSLAAHWHACSGDIPPALVGASATLVDDRKDASKGRLYLFGGRLVSNRRMVNDMYELDLQTLHWTRLFSEQDASSSSAPRPQPRYFHSCNVCDGKLVIFGGMGYEEGGTETDLCVLNETAAFDLATRTWDLDFVQAGEGEEHALPQARYAHLSSTMGDNLVIIGGQDLGNSYLEEINILNLTTRKWTTRQTFDKQRGSYRSLAVEPQWHIANAEAVSPAIPTTPARSRTGSATSFKHAQQSLAPDEQRGPLSLLPTSTRERDENGKKRPLPTYVYTNYNFTDVNREMEVMSLDEREGEQTRVNIDNRSDAMTGVSLPPGLRFPTGAVLGSHLLISGIYLANTSQTFSIWALHLPSMTWTRLEVGPLLATGSWNNAKLWASQNRLVVFGNRDRDLVTDYNHRQANWDHVLLIELDAWGICQPPIFDTNAASLELGLRKLTSSSIGSFHSSLETGPTDALSGREGDQFLSFGSQGDFEIVCADGMTIGCDRVILERRWPWFAKQMRDYRARFKQEAKAILEQGTADASAVTLLDNDEGAGEEASQNRLLGSEPRITPRQLIIGEPSPVVMAMLMYLYTRCICTRLQQHPAIIAGLLIASRVYDMSDLAHWAEFAAHIALSTTLAPPSSTSGGSAPETPVDSPMHAIERNRLAQGIYEAATIGGFEALQIRALRTHMALAKWLQRNSIASRPTSIIGPLEDNLAAKDAHASPRSATAGSRAMSDKMQRLSVSAYDAPPSAGLRRDSRGDRLAMLQDGNDGGRMRSDSSTPGNMGSAHAMLPLAGQRRPSGASLVPNGRNMSSSISSNGLASPSSSSFITTRGPVSAGLPPHPASEAATGRKRFSLFGRSQESSRPLLSGASGRLEPIEGETGDGEYAPATRDAAPPMRRSNTSGSATDGFGSLSGSTSSLAGTHGSATPVPGKTIDGYSAHRPQNGIDGKSNGIQRDRGASIAEISGASAAGRKMTATLRGFKSGGRSATLSNGSGPVGEGIQPGRPLPSNVPSSARSSLATNASSATIMPSAQSSPVSSAGRSLRSESSMGVNHMRPQSNGKPAARGNLSEKDLKALQSIYT